MATPKRDPGMPEIIGPDSVDLDRIEQKRAQLMERLARGLETEQINWAPTEGDEDLGKERAAHLKSAVSGLKKLLQSQPAGPEAGAVSWEVEPS